MPRNPYKGCILRLLGSLFHLQISGLILRVRKDPILKISLWFLIWARISSIFYQKQKKNCNLCVLTAFACTWESAIASNLTQILMLIRQFENRHNHAIFEGFLWAGVFCMRKIKRYLCKARKKLRECGQLGERWTPFFELLVSCKLYLHHVMWNDETQNKSIARIWGNILVYFSR